ncbi:DUF1254-like protein [Mycena venus]|uniref:DUF1254-like protein n=1 Tax=Mycena venus TaxID=2733690 RepID=A0A8H6Z3D6_9AGAR|nr:DUF1254-like protein [Mycena venus]
MHFSVSFISALLLVSSSSLATSVANSRISAQNATVEALVYAFPLQPYVTFANSVANQSGGQWTTNALVHETTLANASFRTIILPNVDTLYSAALLDLSAGDVVVSMPAVEEGRFFVWPFYDLYGNNVCNIGTVTNSTPGKYLIQYRASNPGCAPAQGEYEGIISLPTVYGATLLRIEVSNASDVAHVVSAIQPQFSLAARPPAAVPRAPRLTAALLNGNFSTADPPRYLMELLARVAAYNPPEDASDVPRISAVFAAAGISLAKHTYTPPAGVDLMSAYTAATRAVAAVSSTPADFVALGGGWETTPPLPLGRLPHALRRARQHRAECSFFANETYVVEFFGKPPVGGFWSLTMYGGDGFLVPNAIDRYSVNDRGNMTYPDGTLVYGGGSPSDSDEPFYVLLQSTDHAVSAEWESNWLPTPANSGEFHFVLRWYGPTESLTNGTYKYPNITAVAVNPPLPSSA